MIESLFITAEPLVRLDGRVTALDATARLGTLAPVMALKQLGYDARACSIAEGLAPVEEMLPQARRVVLGEISTDAYNHLLSRIPDAAERVVFSVASDRVDREALQRCFAVTVAWPQLVPTIRELTTRPVYVVPEPCEGARGAPQAFVAHRRPGWLAGLARLAGVPEELWRLRLLWFGQPSGLPPLIEALPALEALAREHPLLLTCSTRAVPELKELLTPGRTVDSSRLLLRFVEWSPPVLDSLIAAHDVVLVPTEDRPNPLLAGLQGGRFVVAHPVPCYEPYAGFAWIGEDLAEGLRWTIRNPQEVLARIARGQRCIDERHSMEAVARAWLEVLDPKDKK